MPYFKDQRIGIFIDIQNLYHSAKNLYQARVNYKELLKEVAQGRHIIRAVGYVVKSELSGVARTPKEEELPQTAEGEARRKKETRPSSATEGAFFDALTKTGIDLRMKDIQLFPGGMKKADWDVGMAVDAIRMAEFLDAVVLVTGDGDFVPLVEYLKWGRGREVDVAAFGRSTSARLIEVADHFIDLEEKHNILLRK